MSIQTKKQQCEFWETVECTSRGLRASMEDCSTILYPFTESPASVLVGVFDGHAGGLCSSFLANSLPAELKKQTKESKSPLPSEDLVKNVFQSTDHQWLVQAKSKSIEDGSTAICVVLDGPDLIVANCGDSRALLYQDGKTTVLSKDHIPEDHDEKKRIIKLGGSVIGGRLQGKLGVSRAFGNIEFKECKYLISEPDVKEVTVEHDAEFLVVGCDGLYEHFSNEEITSFIKTRISSKPLEIVVNDLVEEALDRGTQDNLTVIVVKFNKLYSKLVKKSKKSLSKSQKIFPVSKGFKTSGKSKISPTPMSLSDSPALKSRKDTLRYAGKHPISASSITLDPGSLFPLDRKLKHKSSKSPSPKPTSRSFLDLTDEKPPKSHQGLKSTLFGRTLTKSS
jgi:serine/threonine protein phosphatase PrpC